ncbi:MAG: type I secretion C-terminal target domain-containing protein [Cyanobacteria bacterium P01_E01_bin.6]
MFSSPREGVDKIRDFNLRGDRLDLHDIFDGRKPLVVLMGVEASDLTAKHFLG